MKRLYYVSLFKKALILLFTMLSATLFFAAQNTLSAAPSESNVYRFWSNNKRSHFYTTSVNEVGTIINNYNEETWRYELAAFKGLTGDCTGYKNVYRFWSDSYQSHFYTMSTAERDYIRSNDSNWKYEGVAYCASDTQKAGMIPLYRFWSGSYRSHFFTISESEKNSIISSNPNWKYEGVAYFVLPTSNSDYDEFRTMINAHRSYHGRSMLNYTNELNAAAQGHSNWMNSSSGELSHTGDGGSTPSQRCTNAGTSCSAENVAYYSTGITPYQAFYMWKNSEGHNNNMLNSIHTNFGLGIQNGYATLVLQ